MASMFSRRFIPHFNSFASRLTSTATKNEYHEITIPVPWGHVAGKLWGPKNIRPILSLHGWQDNAGSFDRLIPLLPSHLSYLAIDLPGHGQSSHLPDGLSYYLNDYANLINIIKIHYGWDKVSLMGHSMGSEINFLYACLNSDNCDLVIGIDLLKPSAVNNDKVIVSMKENFETLTLDRIRKKNKSSPPTYTWEELIKRLIKASQGSITLETAHHILDRGSKESPKVANQYYFSRDNRLKSFGYSNYPQDLELEMVKLLHAPYLLIRATNTIEYEDNRNFEEAINVLKEINPRFECITADGGHHIHLTEPENISNEISKFILKYRSDVKSKSKL